MDTRPLIQRAGFIRGKGAGKDVDIRCLSPCRAGKKTPVSDQWLPVVWVCCRGWYSLVSARDETRVFLDKIYKQYTSLGAESQPGKWDSRRGQPSWRKCPKTQESGWRGRRASTCRVFSKHNAPQGEGSRFGTHSRGRGQGSAELRQGEVSWLTLRKPCATMVGFLKVA